LKIATIGVAVHTPRVVFTCTKLGRETEENEKGEK
jgi:hypothetical protein